MHQQGVVACPVRLHVVCIPVSTEYLPVNSATKMIVEYCPFCVGVDNYEFPCDFPEFVNTEFHEGNTLKDKIMPMARLEVMLWEVVREVWLLTEGIEPPQPSQQSVIIAPA